uniref:Uncharacterized protein n=1 Tax=Dulem virus 33 TaxID=3145751 RepID=A0AAU8B5Q7_9CAUD
MLTLTPHNCIKCNIAKSFKFSNIFLFYSVLFGNS